MECSEYRDLAAAHADGALSATEALHAERHVESCNRCDGLRRQQLAAVELVRTRVPRAAVAAPLREAILAKTTHTPTGRTTRRRLVLSGSVAGAIAAALLLALNITLPTRDSTLIVAMARDVEAARSVGLQLELETNDPDKLRSHYALSRLPFSDTVADLANVGFTLVGGGVSTIGDTPTTRTLYIAPGNSQVICRRFSAAGIEWPSGGELVGSSEIFTRQGVQISLKRVGGDVVCAMASKMPRDKFVVAMRTAGR